MADLTILRYDGHPYSATDERGFHALALTPDGVTNARPGVRPRSMAVTVGGTPESVTVTAGVGVVGGVGGSDTPRVVYCPAPVTVTAQARPEAGYSRLAIVQATDSGDGTGTVGVKYGNRSTGTPTAPTLDPGSLLLATLTIPATGAVSVEPGPLTVASGGVLPCWTPGERDSAYAHWGQVAYVRSTRRLAVYDGAAWQHVHTAAENQGPTGVGPVDDSTWFQHQVNPLQVASRAGMVTMFGLWQRHSNLDASPYAFRAAGSVPAWARPPTRIEGTIVNAVGGGRVGIRKDGIIELAVDREIPAGADIALVMPSWVI